MGRQHLRPDGTIRLRQKKAGTEVSIPVLAEELRTAIAAVPADRMTFLQTHLGQPYTANGFYNLFKDAMRKAELPEGLALHGLLYGVELRRWPLCRRCGRRRGSAT